MLDANVAALRIAGATKAYVGWQFENGWISHRRAIVVLAEPQALDRVRSALPGTLGDFPVEIRPDQRPIIATTPAGSLFASALPGMVREEWALPSFPGEHHLDGTDPAALAAAHHGKPPARYQAPAGVSLAEREFDVEELVIHISPELGWAQLEPFLAATTESLTVGMYEFTAPYIDKAVTTALGDPRKMVMTLDSPAEKQGKREQTVEQTERDIAGTLGDRFDFAWALSGLGTESPARAFPTAYHIKVAVRDHDSFWLSSGNWNSSNQPDLDPSDEAALRAAIAHNDRDWHLICQCGELAAIFEDYLKADYALAETTANGEGAAVAMAAAAPPPAIASPLDMARSAVREPKAFFTKPLTVSGKLRLKPLLTPDDYRQPILELIQSAQQRFYMQTQYIHTIDDAKDAPWGVGGVKHMDLIRAVGALIDKGVDVKLITSEFQTKDWIEKLQDAGVDASNCLRIQRNVHNKGIVVDGEVAVISSQNWSSEGTGANRDAGLLIRNREVAGYLEGIFLHDWVNLTSDTQSAF